MPNSRLNPVLKGKNAIKATIALLGQFTKLAYEWRIQSHLLNLRPLQRLYKRISPFLEIHADASGGKESR